MRIRLPAKIRLVTVIDPALAMHQFVGSVRAYRKHVAPQDSLHILLIFLCVHLPFEALRVHLLSFSVFSHGTIVIPGPNGGGKGDGGWVGGAGGFDGFAGGGEGVGGGVGGFGGGGGFGAFGGGGAAGGTGGVDGDVYPFWQTL